MGEVQIVIELAGNPDFTGFYAPVPNVGDGGVRRFAFFKKALQIFKQRSLIAFDGEVVMSLLVFNKIASELALGQQSIGGNDLAVDV